MKKFLTGILTLTAGLLGATVSANAAVLWTDPAGLVFGTVVYPNSTATGTTTNKLDYSYTVDGSIDPTAGNARDYHWIQNTGVNNSTNPALDKPWLGTIWDLHGQANQAVVFPIVDHGPLPAESKEYTVYLTNKPLSTLLSDWTQAFLVNEYTSGWEDDSISIADGYTTVWQLPGGATFRYVSVQGIGSGAIYPTFGDEDEIDAVAGLTVDGGGLAVPEPMTLALFGAGVVGLGALRRRNKKA